MYTLADFNVIPKCSIPMDVKQKIQNLCKKLGTEIPFTIVQDKTRIKDSLRELNKITDENKEEKIKLICSILKETEHELPAFAPVLFQALCKHAFFSKIYAHLFYTLQLQWPCFKTLFETQYTLYFDSFLKIQTCSPDDYDEYCRLKKENDERRSFSLFLVHCVQNKILPETYYDTTMERVVTCIQNTILIDKKELMNEYVEHLYILIDTMKQQHPIVKTLTTLDPKDYPGLNYKIIFRCMDILKIKQVD